MSLDDLAAQAAEKDERNKWVGVFIGVLAVLLAICNVGGANATKDATHANIAASDTWAFFQAKNIRRTATTLAANELELLLAAQPGMPEEAKKKFADKVNDYRAEGAYRYYSYLDEYSLEADEATGETPMIAGVTGRPGD